MIKSSGLFLLLSSCLAAQTVHVANYSNGPFVGWRRCTTDIKPKVPSGVFYDEEGSRSGVFVVGSQASLDTWYVDLNMSLASGEAHAFDLSRNTALRFDFVEPAVNVPSVGGVRLTLLSTDKGGAGRRFHFRGRVSPMLVANVWVTQFPGEAWASGEVCVTASNPTIPDVTTINPSDIAISFSGGSVVIPGAQGGKIIPARTSMADGQTRSLPFTVLWLDQLTMESWSSAGAVASFSVGVNGVSRLWWSGNPLTDVIPARWMSTYWSGAVQRLHTWDAGPLGVKANSGDTGAQEDQIFVGGECMLGTVSAGLEHIRYFTALGQSRRPRTHLEADGSLLSLTTHPKLVMWDSRPHWNTTVSPDQLGKSRAPTRTETRGWWGADEEHWLINTLSISARLTGSQALQMQLQSEAIVFLYQKTIDPRASTSRPGAARAVGWEGIVAVNLWRSLQDRDLAEKVAARWRERVTKIHIPQLGQKPAGIWQTTNDARWAAETGRPTNWSAYQQSVGAYGMWIACSILGPAEGIALAKRAEEAVVLRAFDSEGKGWAEIAFDGTNIVPLVEGDGAHFGTSVKIWHTVGLYALTQMDPANTRARALFQKISADQAGVGNWMPPNRL